MSVYLFYGNNNTFDHDNKLRLFYCNVCGSFDLKNPHESESDHRDVLRFTCNNCKNQPYWSWMHVEDAILLTRENMKMFKIKMCAQEDLDPTKYEWVERIREIIEKDI